MTYFNPKTVLPRDITSGLPIWDEPSNVMDSSYTERYKMSMEHYLVPLSRQRDNPLIRFNTLKAEWEADTRYISSITEISIHPAYQQIIGMGFIALPFILDELRKNLGHWFWALRAITGEDPVIPSDRGKTKKMAAAWVKWGQQEGYIR